MNGPYTGDPTLGDEDYWQSICTEIDASTFAQQMVDAQPAPPTGAAHGDNATPFQAGNGYARRFPTECLPPLMRAYAHDIATRAQVPVDLPALVMLGMVGASAAPRMVVRASAEWAEPVNLYVMCAMSSSAGKSPAVKELRSGLVLAEKVLREQHARNLSRRIAELQQEADDLDMRVNRDPHLPLEQQTGFRSRAKATRAEAEKLACDPPAPPLFAIDGDTTPEALANKLAVNGGQGAIVDDEGTLLRNLGGQYAGGRTANLALFLKAYDCDAYRPARVTRDTQPIDRAALGLVLAPQPGFVADMLRNGIMQDAGFVNRFLVSLPGDLLGQRVGRRSTFIDDALPEPEDKRLRRWWEALLESIARYDVIASDRDLDVIPVIDLSREAYEVHLAYLDEFEPRLHPGRGDLAKVANWAGKHVARVLRVAAVLHLASGRTPKDRISKETMIDAVAIGEWAIEHFLGLGRVVGMSDGAAKIKEFVDNIPAGWTTRNEVNNQVFNKKGRATDLAAWIDELVATGEYVHEKISTGRGRPAEVIRRWDAATGRE